MTMTDTHHTLSIANARAAFSDMVGRARHGKSPTVLTSRGKPVAALVPIEDLELIEEAIDARLSAEAHERIRKGEAPIPWKTVKAKLVPRSAKAAKRR